MERCLLEEKRPSACLNTFLEEGRFDKSPFQLLKQQKLTEQSRLHHPEGNVWNHTLLVVDEAAGRKHESTDPRAFLWAALLHDLGKPAATRTRKGRITAYDHDKIGAELAREFLSHYTEDAAFIGTVSNLVRYHMQLLFVLNDLPFQDIAGMKKSVNLQDLALLCLCDRLGRGGSNRKQEEENVRRFLEKCAAAP